ncbi:DNA polymerase-3 subunit epsilon [Ochrobactrum sp. RC6B]|uniref:DNA polymerase-3 subunit epsilon n=2 Tax=Brucella intermedia TaxID=94625 RepID=A0ABR6AQY7_9HYPH|nr:MULTISPECIES: exonuclease domain-containing protein [Brucella/Ochrobactrum group]ERI14952.1 DNA polymerase III subunit epsilon [Ochrobactrum sp. EGD-AQ16]KAB2672722.1 DNA polymerase III subunit epsilon [Ochrobactrum sp. LMG 5442]PJT24736.1 DNA polymerase III subunit epsilon [Ochrobactrum sp. 30A/1000/2015]PJT37057.1 DNA polymerase III subunit epsilon [Ochrobactrum sp. 27A/999/2015]PJT42112.1 DNA polymerase III subunit epsilon [Ochrobactrum sp. 23A/997/2015]
MDELSNPAVHTRKKRVIVVDTETTGLLPYDRIVTIGAVKIEGDELLHQSLHLIFDPRKDSHPQAEAVHGYDNWMTRYQDLFSDLAAPIRKWFDWADEIVAHNADFDMRYVQREFRKAEVDMLPHPVFCTMERSREIWSGQSAKLDDCLARIGLSRIGKRHGALEDAYLTAGLYLHQRGIKKSLPKVNSWSPPKNLKPYPPRPEGELPRRAPKRK